MGLDRTHAEEEPLGDLLIGQPFGDQLGDLRLPGGQSVRQARTPCFPRRRGPYTHAAQFFERPGVQPACSAGVEDRRRGAQRLAPAGPLARPVVRQPGDQQGAPPVDPPPSAAQQADFVLVEGVGGWLAPLSATLDQLDLVRALDLPVVLVVGMRLGCLNHARLSARAIEADGARLAGWIASEVDPDMARRDENFDALRARLPAPCLGRLAWSPSAEPAALAAELGTNCLMLR